MPPPTSLVIKTGSVRRLIKEEASYHKEIDVQKKSLEKILAQPEPDVYEVRQQKTVVEQTIAMIPAVRKRLTTALEALESEYEKAPERECEDSKEKAQSAIKDAKTLLSKEVEGGEKAEEEAK